MAVKCLTCKYLITQDKGLHMVSKCPECGESDRSKLIRVEEEDYTKLDHEKDREWLESHKAKE